MRIVFAGAVALLLAGMTGNASAIEYPWCADISTKGGATNCGFVSYGQCRAYISGVGGYCRENLFYHGPASGPYAEAVVPPRTKKHRHVAH